MKRWKMQTFSAVAVAAALAWTLRAQRPQPEGFAIDASLPAGAVARIGTPLFGPVGGMNSDLLALSPDGSRVYTCGADGMLRAWDADTAAPLWQVAAHADYVPPADADIDRRWDGIRNQWRGYREEPRDMVLSPDGRRVATCAGGVIRVFDAATGTCVGEARTSEATQQLDWTADGRAVLRCEERRVVRWDVDDDDETRSVEISKEWLHIATRDDGTIVVFEVNQVTRAARLLFLDGTTLAATRAPVGVPGGLNLTQVLDERGRVLALQLVPQQSPAQADRSSWNWFDPADGSIEYAFDSEQLELVDVAPRPGAPWIFTGLSGVELARDVGGARRRICGGSIHGAAVSADGRRVAIAALGHARIYDIASERFLHDAAPIVSPGVFVAHPDGRRLLVGGADGALLECDIDTGRVLRSFALGNRDVEEIRIARDGRIVAGRNGGAFRIELETGEVATFKEWFASTVAIRDGRVIGLRALNSRWSIVDLASGAEAPLAGAPYTSLNNATFSEDSAAFRAEFPTRATAGLPPTMWDTATGAVLATSATPPRFAARLIHPLDENDLCSTITDAETGAVLVTFSEPLDPKRDGIWPLAADDRLVAFGSPSGEIRVVARPDGREVARFRGPTGVPSRIDFVPGGKRLLSGHPDGTILVWSLEGLLR